MFRIDRSTVDISHDPAEIKLTTPEIQPDAGMEPNPDVPEVKKTSADPEQVLAEARAESQIIIQQAMMEAESLRQQANNEGFEAGRNDAQAQFAQIAQEEQAAFGALTQSMKQEYDNTLMQMGEQAVSLAVSIAQKILGIELDRNDNAFLTLAEQAVEKMKSSGKITLRVSADDYGRFFADGATLQGLASDILLDIVQDSKLAPGSCIVESGMRTIDASVGTQLERVEQAFAELDGESQ